MAIPLVSGVFGAGLTLFAAGCDPQPHCLESSSPLALDAPSPGGPSASEVLASLALDHEFSATWEAGESAGFAGAGSPVSVTISVSPIAESARWIDRSENPKDTTDLAAECADQLVVDLAISVQSDDGRIQIMELVAPAVLVHRGWSDHEGLRWSTSVPVGDWQGAITRSDFSSDADEVSVRIDGCADPGANGLTLSAELVEDGGDWVSFGSFPILRAGECEFWDFEGP
jgi:hypothetical protein